jgi:hypothetical protein
MEQTTEIIYFVSGLIGSLIVILFSIIGYFLKIIHTDIKYAVNEVGKNKGRIELVEQQLTSDVKRIEQNTQLELRNLAENVSRLSDSVEKLVDMQLNRHQ